MTGQAMPATAIDTSFIQRCLLHRGYLHDPALTPGHSPETSGRATTLLLVPGSSATALGPLWSVLCGASAAVRQQWQQAGGDIGVRLLNLIRWPDSEVLVGFLLTVFVVGVLWNTWRALLVDMDWAGAFARHPLPPAGERSPTLPYGVPWSLPGRVLRQCSGVHHWLRTTAPTELRGALVSLPIVPPLILVLSGIVGPQMALLSLAALALSLIEWRVSRQGQAHYSLQAGLQVGLSWLAGHVALAPLTWSSFTLACCYATAFQGALYFDRPAPARAQDHLRWPLLLLYGGQAASLGLLVALERPEATAAVGLLLAPQLLLVPLLWSGERQSRFLERVSPFVMMAMAISAWTA